jgi:hypothetical protein
LLIIAANAETPQILCEQQSSHLINLIDYYSAEKTGRKINKKKPPRHAEQQRC